jgi:hypothetical protein
VTFVETVWFCPTRTIATGRAFQGPLTVPHLTHLPPADSGRKRRPSKPVILLAKMRFRSNLVSRQLGQRNIAPVPARTIFITPYLSGQEVPPNGAG